MGIGRSKIAQHLGLHGPVLQRAGGVQRLLVGLHRLLRAILEILHVAEVHQGRALVEAVAGAAGEADGVIERVSRGIEVAEIIEGVAETGQRGRLACGGAGLARDGGGLPVGVDCCQVLLGAVQRVAETFKRQALVETLAGFVKQRGGPAEGWDRLLRLPGS